MASPSSSPPRRSSSPPYKRKRRQYLLEPRFQLKYTGMVVAVTVVVAGILGYFAYDFSTNQTRQLAMNMALQPDLYPEVAADMEAWARAEDRRVLSAIVTGIIVLVIALGTTGVIITHRVVGPAYKIKRVLGEVAHGRYTVDGGLRHRDELQDVFEGLASMIEALRARQTHVIAELEASLAPTQGDDARSARLQKLRDEALATLAGRPSNPP